MARESSVDSHILWLLVKECLNYALRNRAEWEERGQAIVEEMMEELNPQAGRQDDSAGTASTEGDSVEE